MILYTPVPMDMVFPVRQPEPVTLERDGQEKPSRVENHPPESVGRGDKFDA